MPVAVVAGFWPTVQGVYNRRASGQAVADYLQAGWTGISPNGGFNVANLRVGLIPVLAGFVVHKLAGMIGVNRALAQARVPLVRV